MDDTVGSVGTNSAKRVRDESDESPEAKRFRAADLILLDILEDVDSADRNLATPAVGDLATVLKSFEEEIAALSPRPSQQQQQQEAAEDVILQQLVSSASISDADEPRHSDLDYLLEASDDELGLPPTAPSSDEGEGTEGDLVEAGVQDSEGFGHQIWGFDDDIPSYYDALGFPAFGQEDDRAAAGGGDAVVFDGGLFEYTDAALAGQPDFSDCSWRPEFLPAV